MFMRIIFPFIAALTLAVTLVPNPALATTFYDDALNDLGAGDLLDPGRNAIIRADRDREILEAARANFSKAVDALERELSLRADYSSILAVADQLKTYAPTDSRIYWLDAIARAANGDLPAARAAADEAALRANRESSSLPMLAQGMIAYREGRSGDAEALLLDATRQTADNAYAFNLLGTVQSDLGKTDEAEASFKAAIALAPETVVFQRNLGLVQLASSQAARASETLDAALALDPEDCLTVTAAAQVRVALLRLTEAEIIIRQCVDRPSPSPVAVAYLVEILIRQNAFEEALAAIKSNAALLGDPTAATVEVLLRLNRPMDAIAVLDDAQPDSAADALRRVLATAMAGNTQAASEAMRLIVADAPWDAGTALVSSALAVAAGGQPDQGDIARLLEDQNLAPAGAVIEMLAGPAEAMAGIAPRADGFLPGVRFKGLPAADWEQLTQPAVRSAAAKSVLWLLRGNDLAARAALADVKEDVHFLRYLDAVAATRLGDPAAASTVLRPTAVAVPQFFSAQVLMAELDAANGRLEDAFTHYRNAVAQVEDGALLMRVALIGDILGEVPIAEDALRRFIALYPDSFIGYNQLAWLFIQREIRLDEALTLAQKADTLQPGNASVLDNLGWIYFLTGRSEDALDVLREANRVSVSSNPDIVFHLALAENEFGSQSESRELLVHFLDMTQGNHPSAGKAQMLLGQTEQKQ